MLDDEDTRFLLLCAWMVEADVDVPKHLIEHNGNCCVEVTHPD